MGHCRQHVYMFIQSNSLSAANKTNIRGQGIGDCGRACENNAVRYTSTDSTAICEACFDTVPTVGVLNFVPNTFTVLTANSACSYIENNATNFGES